MRRWELLALGLLVGCRAPAPSPPPRRTPARPAEAPRPGLELRPAAVRLAPRPPGWQAVRTGELSWGSSPLAAIGVLRAGAGHVVVAAMGGAIRGWRAPRAEPAWRLAFQPVRDLGLSGDARSWLITTADGTNHVLRVVGDRLRPYRRWKRRSGRSQGLTGDGGLLVRGDVRGQIRGLSLSRYKLRWLTHATRVWLSRDGQVAACEGEQGLQLLDSVRGRALAPALPEARGLVALGVHAANRWVALQRVGATCRLLRAGLPPLPHACLPDLRISWTPGGSRYALAGQGVAAIYAWPQAAPLLMHGEPGATLHVAFVDEDSYVIANLPEPGRLTRYSLRRR